MEEIIATNGNDLATEMTTPALTFCSVKADTKDDKIKMYNAMNNPDFKIGDFINKKLTIKDVLVEIVEIVDEETGECNRQPRTVIIDMDGHGYMAMSNGVFNSVKNLINVFGAPTWPEGVTVEVKQQQVKNGSMLFLQAV